MSHLRLCMILACMSVIGIAMADAATFQWKSEFTQSSSAELAALHESIHRDYRDSLSGYSVSGEIWKEEDFELVIESGTLFLEPPIDGTTFGAFFEGNATVSYLPARNSDRNLMKTTLGMDRLEKVPVTSAYIFTLRDDSLISRLASRDAPTDMPEALETYIADKSAMRQFGLRLIHLFLNRRSDAQGATFVLFPVDAIREPQSEEARMLYGFDPSLLDSVQLSVFGHERMVALKPHKFRFYPLVSYPSPKATPGSVDVRKTSVRITLGTTANSAQETAKLELSARQDLQALRLNLTTGLEVSAISSDSDGDLPFLQWRDLRNDPDFDQTILISVSDLPKDGVNITIESAGLLFEPWLGSFILMDEDNWFPRLDANDDSLYELEMTIPKRLTGIGVGESIRESTEGQLKHVAFRTGKPTKNSTFYYGDYTKTEGKADSISVELYQDRKDLGEQKRAKYVISEIANALRVFSDMFVPLDIDTLRVTSTLRQHGRGFEGLLLLGAQGTEVSSESWADLLRAHEVAHQWWGHYVRPKHWPQDRWLSESLAEYSAMEYYKARFDSHAKALQVMKEQWVEPLTFGTMEHVTLLGDRQTLFGGTVQPLCAGTNNVYTKGPMVLNMLRYLFFLEKGEDTGFFELLKDFLQSNAYQEVTTADFRSMAEKHIGTDLQWFFDQWFNDGGIPMVKWRYDVARDGDSWILSLRAEQVQKNYRLIVPIYVHFSGNKVAVRPWLIEGESATRQLKLPAAPSSVTLNDNLESLVILKELRKDS